jgi:nitrite reductase/ring-hydroxylating ferredoxin subunit/uncharacterized membrane protein
VAPRIIEDLVERIAEMEGLDKVATPLANAVSRINPPGRAAKDVLSGTWLGHPLHPLLTDIPNGAWTSALILDLFGGDSGERAADQLVGLGTMAALPTAVSGLSDWSDMLGAERRVGFVHALGNVAAVTFFGLSYLSRRRGKRGQGLALSVLGATAATVGGYLGGHLTLPARSQRRPPRLAPRGSGVGGGGPGGGDRRRQSPGEARSRGHGAALETRRPDRGCVRHLRPRRWSLHEGEIDNQGQVTCPWHGSTFRLHDGEVVHGPATGPQPVYDVRVEDGKVLVRRRA